MTDSKFLIGIMALSRYTGFHRNWLRPKVYGGQIPAYGKKGRQFIFLKQDIDAWMGGNYNAGRNSGKDSTSAGKSGD